MGRNAPNLYELLKAAGSRAPAGSEPDTGTADTASKTLTPPPMKVVLPPVEEETEPEPAAPAPPPLPASPAADAPPPRFPLRKMRFGLGERTVQVTWNTAAFAALVVVGVVFLAYAIGHRVGRASSAANGGIATQPPPARPLDQALAPQGPPPVYTIRLMEWPARTNRERANANANAASLKTALESRQLPGAEYKLAPEGDRVILNFGRFTEIGTAEAKQKLAQLREFRLPRNPDPVFKGAGFVRVN